MARNLNANRIGWSTFRTDLFGRTKVAEPFTIFDSNHRYQESRDYSDETSGTASSVYLPNESSSSLTIGSSQGDLFTRESKRVFPYQPGKSLQVMQTFVFNEPKTGLRQRAGYFSRTNGVFLELLDDTLYLVLRTYTSGQVVENRVPQSQWNVDRIDGTGPTDLDLDISKAQIFITEYEWLGVGSVRCGFMIDGVFITAHQFNHANNVESVYMTTATLPIRYEIENLASTSSNSRMKQICATVISNGGYLKITDVDVQRVNSKTVTTSFTPIVALRMAPGRTDAVVLPATISIFPTTAADFEWALLRNPTLTGGTWVTNTPRNNVQYNITATSLTGGDSMLEGFFGAENQSATPAATDGSITNFAYQLGRTNADPAVSDLMVLAARVAPLNNENETGVLKASLGWYDLT